MRVVPITALMLATALPAHSQSDDAELRERAIANCKANRGTDCETADGLKEWIEAERPRPPGQRSAIQMQKLEAERQAKQRKEEADRRRALEEKRAK